MSDEATTEYPKIIYTLSFWMSMLILCGIATLFYWLGQPKPEGLGSSLCSSIASNLYSAFIFAIIVGLISNKSLIGMFKQVHKKGNDDLAKVVVNTMTDLNKKYIPAEIYREAQGYDSKFNEDLTVDQKKSKSYLFRGVSAKYVAPRLKNVRHGLESVKVIILDPTSTSFLALRAGDLKKQKKNSSKSEDDLIKEIKEEIYFSIVSLFDTRNRMYPICICLVEETSVYRLEILDSGLYLSDYQDPEQGSNTFPTTYKYTNNSSFYKMFDVDSKRKIDDKGNKTITFERGTNESLLVDFLSKNGMEGNCEAEIKRLRERYESFSKKFVEGTKIDTY